MSKSLRLLLPHERKLVEEGLLIDETHEGSSSIWLHGKSTETKEKVTTVYRPMGDTEILFLVEHNQLPDTQPYQAIIEGDNGRTYSEKYLKGHKWVDTSPTTVVEFVTPVTLIKTLFEKQHKAEDGAISMGLGHKAGKGLPLFNASLLKGETTWRVVKVKRAAVKSSKKPAAAESTRDRCGSFRRTDAVPRARQD